MNIGWLKENSTMNITLAPLNELFFTVHPGPMLNSHLAAKSFFSGLILGLEIEKKEIPFPFPLSDLL